MEKLQNPPEKPLADRLRRPRPLTFQPWVAGKDHGIRKELSLLTVLILRVVYFYRVESPEARC